MNQEGFALESPKPAPTKANGQSLPFEDLLPDTLDVPEFRDAWTRWCAERRARRKPMTVAAAGMQLRKLAGLGVEKAVLAIDRSIENGWQGLFEPDPPRVQRGTLADVDHSRGF